LPFPGKSTIADFIFYILGGEFDNWKTVAANCNEVQAEVVTQGGVLTLPTQSYYTFTRLADPNDIKRFGPVSPEPDGVDHAGPSGDTGDYRSDQVLAMAYSLAVAVA
jgi:hypothetical protein